MKKALLCLLVLLASHGTYAQKTKVKTKGVAASTATDSRRWTVAKAQAWYKTHPWITGANFTPSTAINQLEMWQAATFDPATIDKELGYAEGIGFNTMRVFLHSLAWQQDPNGFKDRINTYLSIADKHHIQTMFVFFDDCWNKEPKAGVQPEPKPGIHNSGWMQDPGESISRDSVAFVSLKPYVQDVLRAFSSDKRILLWDLYNEPGNSGKLTASLPLVRNVFAWAREINPEQPVSIGLWNWDYGALNTYQAMHSDVITYHSYDEAASHQRVIDLLQTHDRPMICTEYMARTRNSRFATIMPMLKKRNVGAINWGLVDGKTNTKYQWETPLPDGSEPVEWFHEVFRKDGRPYREDETTLIRNLNRK
jgi:hypothetical protein